MRRVLDSEDISREVIRSYPGLPEYTHKECVT